MVQDQLRDASNALYHSGGWNRKFLKSLCVTYSRHYFRVGVLSAACIRGDNVELVEKLLLTVVGS